MWDYIAKAEFIRLLYKAGPLMIPVLLCSLLSLAIIIERFIYFSSVKLNISGMFSEILNYVRKNRIREAIEFCEKTGSYVSNILKAGLFHYDQPKEVVREAMENASLYEIPKLERNLNFLGTLAHISPLLGLLGTVVGLVKCFAVIEQKAISVGVVNPSDLAGGIWEALLTTAGGLSVAIPSFLAYNYFVHRVNMYVLSAERASTELLEVLSERSYSSEI